MKKVTVILFIFIAFFQSSCDSCSDKNTISTSLNENQLSFIPYKGDEELKFLSEGDTIKLKGNGINWTSERGSEADQSGYGCDTWYSLSVKNYDFSDSNFSLILSLTPAYGIRNTKIMVKDKFSNKESFSVECDCGFADDCWWNDFENLEFKGENSDSTLISGKMHYRVFGYNKYWLYNFSEGILKFGFWNKGITKYRSFERIL